MTIFAVVALDQTASAALATEVATKFQGKSFQVAPGHFLINAPGTAQDISVQLSIHEGRIGHAIVYNVGGYYGYGPNTIWEWLRANMTVGATGATGA